MWKDSITHFFFLSCFEETHMIVDTTLDDINHMKDKQRDMLMTDTLVFPLYLPLTFHDSWTRHDHFIKTLSDTVIEFLTRFGSSYSDILEKTMKNIDMTLYIWFLDTTTHTPCFNVKSSFPLCDARLTQTASLTVSKDILLQWFRFSLNTLDENTLSVSWLDRITQPLECVGEAIFYDVGIPVVYDIYPSWIRRDCEHITRLLCEGRDVMMNSMSPHTERVTDMKHVLNWIHRVCTVSPECLPRVLDIVRQTVDPHGVCVCDRQEQSESRHPEQHVPTVHDVDTLLLNNTFPRLSSKDNERERMIHTQHSCGHMRLREDHRVVTSTDLTKDIEQSLTTFMGYKPSSCSFTIDPVGGKVLGIQRLVNYSIIHETGAYVYPEGRVLTENVCLSGIEPCTYRPHCWTSIIPLSLRKGIVPHFTDKHIRGLEDMRVFSHSEYPDTLFALATSFEYSFTGSHPTQVFCVIDKTTMIIQNIIVLEHDRHTCQKNWLPFVDPDDHEIYIIYGWSPYTLLHIPMDHEKKHPVLADDLLIPAIRPRVVYEQWIPHINTEGFRGSASPVYFERRQEWQCIIHEVYTTPDRPTRKYRHRVVTLDKTLRHIKHVTEPFVFENEQIEYCLGFLLNQGLVMIHYSLWDNSSHLLTFQVDDWCDMIDTRSAAYHGIHV